MEACDNIQGEDEMEPLISQLENITVEEETQGKNRDHKGSIRVVLLSTAFALCGSFIYGFCVHYTSPTESAIREDLNLSLPQYSVFASMLAIGAMLGALTCGYLTDFIGRKGAMSVSAVFCIVGWLAICFAKGALLLDIGRMCTGYGSGVFSYVVPVFIAEIAPKDLRGGLMTMNELMRIVGGSICYLLGTVVTWRILALAGLTPSFILLLGMIVVPESPRWLAMNGRHKEFEAALQRLRGKDADISFEAAEIKEYIETLQCMPRSRMLDLFQRRYLYSIIVGVGLMVLKQLGGISAINSYASEILILSGFSSGNMGTIVIACSQIPVTILGVILMDYSGRRPLLLVSAIGTLGGNILMGFSFYLKLFLWSYTLGMAPISWIILTEIFPINIKATAGSLATWVNWFISWLVSYTFNFLLSWSSSGPFFLFSGIGIATVLFVAKLVPETKRQTLEEIQAAMNAFNAQH
uniref:Putative sugar transporter ERD6-like 7 isoform X1 n=1 Tax=Davidia involucrata TaxID=16924 RepID=A0A5B7AW91_DAVIN